MRAELMSWDWSGGQAVLVCCCLTSGVAQLIGAGGAGARAAGPLDETGRGDRTAQIGPRNYRGCR